MRGIKANIAVVVIAAQTVAQAAAADAKVPIPDTIEIPAGAFVRGSDRDEREAAYRLDEAAYGHSVTRKNRWYEDEPARGQLTLPTYRITRTLITNAQYATFVAATGHRAPEVTAAVWKSYGLIHPYSRTRRHAWRDAQPPKAREQHPVVLVSHGDARAYAAWLSERTGESWRLPSEAEWEKAARGPDGRRFPWGDVYDPARLNSHDLGPFDTTAVPSFADGASPYGLQDAAGQVFEWTRTKSGDARYIVKGGSWDDKGCGICRPAARHSRPEALKHILIGFRLVRE
ncbi:MAG: SUMF1/EgtB/PvdO family nonheme iron enzyme [Alphaproteobacteria bacterium]|jgi:formylglycine-generating enzyme required for sulfatase activity|nr:SUMF1/EgtB/PvdO family nonheme iron enzyme [Alphaproteobacteria bacterium]